MPAMPIAESSAPIVVGIRQTSSATSTMTDCSALGVDGERLQGHDGEQEDDREPGEQDVRARSRSASSGGSRPRRARSSGRGSVSPGCGVMRTTIWSDSTRVPPVTAERSPPDSRMTGADSPVIADSSTLAMPSMTSPSPGITSPADDDAPRRRRRAAELGDLLDRAVRPDDGARPCRARVLRSVVGLGLAPALGHRLGEVGEQHGEPEPERRRARRRRSRRRRRPRSGGTGSS